MDNQTVRVHLPIQSDTHFGVHIDEYFVYHLTDVIFGCGAVSLFACLLAGWLYTSTHIGIATLCDLMQKEEKRMLFQSIT